MKACKVCHRLVDKLSMEAESKKGKGDTKAVADENVCPACHNPTSKTWQGYLLINDPKKSRIARKMNINSNGRYALKVR